MPCEVKWRLFYLHLARLSSPTPTWTIRGLSTGDAHIFKYAIINFALPRPLDNDFLSAGYERPKFGRLWLLGRIGAEGEVDSSVGQVRMTGGIGDLKFLNC